MNFALLDDWLLFFGLIALILYQEYGTDSDDETDTSDDQLTPPEEDPAERGITQIFTGADDTFEATELNDRVAGMGGDDSLSGLGGNDVMTGNVGNDTVFGNDGNDTVLGGGDTDQLFGGDGDDLLASDRVDFQADFTRGGEETLSGGDGNDTLIFSADDKVTGGDGDDLFGMYLIDDGPATVTDFVPGEDAITIYVEGLDEAASPPDVTFAQDEDTATTTISVGDQQAVVLDGLFDDSEIAPILKDQNEITGEPA